MKKRRIKGWVIALCVIGVLGVISLAVVFTHLHTEVKKMEAHTDAVLTIFHPPADSVRLKEFGLTDPKSFSAFGPTDSMLFRESALKDLASICMTTSDTRYDLKELKYKEDILLFYTPIVLDRDMALDEVLVFQVLKTPRASTPSSFFEPFSLRISKTQPRHVDSIVCNYTGEVDLLKETRYSDDFISYYMPIKTFAVRYGINKPVDMSLHSNSMDLLCRFRPIPFTFAFLKKGRTVYFIALTVNVFLSEYEEKYRKEMDGLPGKIIHWEQSNGSDPDLSTHRPDL